MRIASSAINAASTPPGPAQPSCWPTFGASSLDSQRTMSCLRCRRLERAKFWTVSAPECVSATRSPGGRTTTGAGPGTDPPLARKFLRGKGLPGAGPLCGVWILHVQWKAVRLGRDTRWRRGLQHQTCSADYFRSGSVFASAGRPPGYRVTDAVALRSGVAKLCRPPLEHTLTLGRAVRA